MQYLSTSMCARARVRMLRALMQGRADGSHEQGSVDASQPLFAHCTGPGGGSASHATIDSEIAGGRTWSESW
jgi:hypothetical protein